MAKHCIDSKGYACSRVDLTCKLVMYHIGQEIMPASISIASAKPVTAADLHYHTTYTFILLIQSVVFNRVKKNQHITQYHPYYSYCLYIYFTVSIHTIQARAVHKYQIPKHLNTHMHTNKWINTSNKHTFIPARNRSPVQE